MKNLKKIQPARFWVVLPVWAALLLGSCVFAEKEADKTSEVKSIVIMTWNLNNFFDAIETGSEYDEFRESAGWSTEKYLGRVNTVASAIGKIDPAPDIIAVQEIESELALEDLAKSLSGYSWIHFANNPDAAIGLGIISRFPLNETRVHSIVINGIVTPRPVLETRIEAGGEPLVLFVCHWKSKVGGEVATEEGRRASARVILRRVRELAQLEPQLPAVIMGDLNINHNEFYRRNGNAICALLPDDPECAELTNKLQLDFIIVSGDKPPQANCFNGDALAFYSPWTRELKNGSYFYKNDWETIDHFLLSEQLFNNRGWDFDDCTVIDYQPFVNSKGYPVSYNPKTGAGLSDHLPLLLFLKMQE